MATAQHLKEAAQAAITFHVAMIYLGNRAFVEVFKAWGAVVPTPSRVVSTGASFLEESLKLVRQRRHQVEAIAIPYLRLMRALHTGTTFQPIFPTSTTTRPPINSLRRDFIDAIARYAPEALEGSAVDMDPTDGVDEEHEVENPDGSKYTPYNIEAWLDDVIADLEEIAGLEDALDKLEANMEDEARSILENLGPKYLQVKLKELQVDDRQQSAREVDAEREEAHAQVGRRLGAHAERMVENGGRYTEITYGNLDNRVLGFVRVHEPHNDIIPCGWCCLMLSRGFVRKRGKDLYASKRAAGSDNDHAADQFHTPDHCKPEAVYSMEQVDNDARFDMNRRMAALYKDQIQGKFSGDRAISQWRKTIRNLRAAQAAARSKE